MMPNMQIILYAVGAAKIKSLLPLRLNILYGGDDGLFLCNRVCLWSFLLHRHAEHLVCILYNKA